MPTCARPSILRASVSWINRGLPLRRLKIVTSSETAAQSALETFLQVPQFAVVCLTAAWAGDGALVGGRLGELQQLTEGRCAGLTGPVSVLA